MEFKPDIWLNKLIKKHNGLVKVITGLQRCGKSYLMEIEGNFKKIIITKDSPTMWYTEEGILVMSVYDFMLNENSLDE